MNEKLPELREKANRLPLLPGVYIMKDARGEVIYVGKAKALKNRVSSYFRGEHLPKVAAMADKVDDFDVIVVSTRVRGPCPRKLPYKAAQAILQYPAQATTRATLISAWTTRANIRHSR